MKVRMKLGGSVKAGLPQLERLLGSKTRARLLSIFATNPREEFLASQLILRSGLSETSVRYELPRLVHLGLVRERKVGQEKLYRANDTHPLFPEIKQMVYKTAGLGEALRQAIGEISGVIAAFIYGSVAKGTENPQSDIDLFILGSPKRSPLSSALRRAEERIGREINLTSMTPAEWRERRAANETFTGELLRSPKIFLIGDEQSLSRA